MRTIRKEDPEGTLILPSHIASLEGITLAGERCDVETFKWVQQHFGNIFVNDTYWQT
jgi:propionyl-CoA synthetase